MNEREYYEVKNYRNAINFMIENNKKNSLEKIKKLL